MGTTTRTHCVMRGHHLATVGIYANGCCVECKRIYNLDRATHYGKARYGKAKAKRVPRPDGAPATNTTQHAALEAQLTNRLMHLLDDLDRASTWWDRETIATEMADVRRRLGA